jgi:autotransporter passenger strand-loop-strand repeat protein
VAIGTTYNGGIGGVLSGGVESGAIINSGGREDVFSGGSPIAVRLRSSGL